ncbi:MAG: ribosome hibernation-promoting factor, HPF/YfiA family [Candidatus Sumerlaeaceae bacterium]
MATRITGHQLKITNDMRAYIEGKIPRLQKYTDRIQMLDIVLERDGNQIVAELRLKSGPVEVNAKHRDHDAMRAFDLLVDKVEVQLKKKWEKLKGKKKDMTLANRNAKKADLSGPEAGMDARPVGRVAALKRPSVGALPTRAGARDKRDLGGESRRRGNGDARTPPAMLEKLNVRVFPSERHVVDRMDVNEAAEELFFKDENFFCFINEDTGIMNVVYRRKDGNFAVIEPEH